MIAGYAAAIKLNNLVITCFGQLGTGMSNYVSQNIGAGRHERIAPGIKAGILMGLGLCVPVVLLYFIFPALPISLFMDGAVSGEAMRTGVQFLRIVSPFYAVVFVKLLLDGVLRGAGRMAAFMIDTFTDLLLRVGLCIVFSAAMGSVGIWCSWPVGWVLGTVLAIAFTLRYLRSVRA